MKKNLFFVFLVLAFFASLTACVQNEVELTPTLEPDNTLVEFTVFSEMSYYGDATELVPSVGCQNQTGQLEAGYEIPFQNTQVYVGSSSLEHDLITSNFPARIWVRDEAKDVGYQITFCNRSGSNSVYYFIEDEEKLPPEYIEEIKEQLDAAHEPVQNILFRSMAFQGDAYSDQEINCINLTNPKPLRVDIMPFRGKQVTVNDSSISFDWNGPQEAQFPVKIWAEDKNRDWYEITICKGAEELQFSIELVIND